MLELNYIPAEPSHIPYVAHSWMTSFKNAACVRGVEDDLYFPWMKQHVAGILKRANCMVAVDPQDSDLVIGYIVYEGNTLHYGYVRHGYRKEGIFKTLLDTAATRYRDAGNAGFSFSCYTFQSSAWDHGRSGLRFTPFFISNHH